MKIRFIPLLWLALLTACSTGKNATPQTRYYVLDATPVEALEKSGRAVKLAKVRVADYLNQPNLVMRQPAQQFNVARYHLWAESLPLLLHRALKDELNRKHPSLHFVRQCSDCASIAVSVDHFYPTHTGQVVLAGEYEINDKNQNTLIRRSFALQDSLGRDGYPASVKALRGLLLKLAEQMTKEPFYTD